MTESTPRPGSIGWVDLTVADAPRIRDFYAEVVGWTTSGVDMGGYEDWCMLAADGAPVAGVCHARGPNAGMPAQWLMYVTVDDLERSAARVVELGGAVLHGPREAGGGRMCVIRDPAGAVCALYESGGTAG